MTERSAELRTGRHLFIVGTTHSGSTVLYRLLAYHPDFAWFSQFSFRDGSVPGCRRLPLAAAWDRIGRRWPHPWTKNTHAGRWAALVARLVPSPNEALPVWQHIFPHLKHEYYHAAAAADIESRLLATLGRCLERQQRERALVKVPRLAQAVPALASVLPKSMFLHIVRDGKAVAVSPGPSGERGGAEALAHARKRALYWRETVCWFGSMEERLGRSRAWTVRYEDLCADPRGVVREILEWSAAPTSENVLTLVPERLDSTNRQRFSETPVVEREVIMGELRNHLGIHGYREYGR